MIKQANCLMFKNDQDSNGWDPWWIVVKSIQDKLPAVSVVSAREFTLDSCDGDTADGMNACFHWNTNSKDVGQLILETRLVQCIISDSGPWFIAYRKLLRWRVEDPRHTVTRITVLQSKHWLIGSKNELRHWTPQGIDNSLRKKWVH